MRAADEVSIHRDEITARAPTFANQSDSLANNPQQLRVSLHRRGAPSGMRLWWPTCLP
jgi:hypothetical protein